MIGTLVLVRRCVAKLELRIWTLPDRSFGATSKNASEVSCRQGFHRRPVAVPRGVSGDTSSIHRLSCEHPFEKRQAVVETASIGTVES